MAQDPFHSEISAFAYQNNHVFKQMSKAHNKEVCSHIKHLHNERELKRGNDIKKVCERYLEPEESNKSLHDYLHLLAHCINEEAVLVIRRESPREEKLYRQLVVLARAIMLLVSEDTETYSGANSFKTCFATVYAEAGEFHVASKSISDIISMPEYNRMDIASKA